MSKIEGVLIEEKVFYIDRAKQGRAACKKCKEKCLAGELRIAKLAPSPSGFGKIKNWYHVDCIFQVFFRQRSTTIRITSCDDINGWSALGSADKDYVLGKISDNELAIAEKSELKVSRKSTTSSNKMATFKRSSLSIKIEQPVSGLSLNNAENDCDYSKDLYFREFRRFVADIGNKGDNSHFVNIIKKFFVIGRDGNGFKGDMLQWCRLLFPEVRKRTCNLQIRHLIKIFGQILHVDQTIMNKNLETGSDVGEVIQICYERNKQFLPPKKSLLLIQEVDEFVDRLTFLQKEDEQIKHFEQFLNRCTSNDLKVLIRIIAHNLPIAITLQQVLETIHPSVYKSYRTCKNLEIAFRIFNESSTDLMTPIRYIFSESCRSIKQVLKKCINGCYAEIKYHGERVQIHKDGSNFKYFSKNLKPIACYKTAQTNNILIKSFPSAKNFVIDCTFVHKKLAKMNKKIEIGDKMCTIYVFDCLYYNGVPLTNKSIEKRKSVLKTNLKEIPNQVVLLPFKIIHDKKELSPLIDKVLDMERETIILKNIKSVYDSRIPCWFTIERDSLYSGPTIEPLHLIVLGYFNDSKGSVTKMSYFLMGCYDSNRCKYCTVVKVFIDLDTKTCEKLQDELKTVEINRDLSKVPDWLICTKTMVPDFVTKISGKQPVWEITGSEYITNCNVHTADRITIRHPRILKIKSSRKATEVTLDYVKNLCINSKQFKTVEIAQKKDNYIKEKSLKRKRSISSTSSSKLFKMDDESFKPETFKIASETKTHIFQAIKLLVENGAEIEFQDALYSFIDHGGIVLKLENWKDATHILHLEDSIFEQNIRCPKNAHHVIVEWIVDSINNNALQDFRSYTVRWEPSGKVIV